MIADAAHIDCARNASYPVRPGNHLRPLVDGVAAFRRICEAVEAARARVFVTVAFIDRDAPMPDGRGSFFDVLDAAVTRGVEVRALFWREPRIAEFEPGSNHFGGTAEEREWLAARGSRFSARWDRLPGGWCQHQKTWLIDAGEPTEVAFVGGINLDTGSTRSASGHAEGDHEHIHDVYLELRGPAASDVHHNFVQRWNGASDREQAHGAWPAPDRELDLGFPVASSREAGGIPVQITRTVQANRYSGGPGAPGHAPFDVSAGETSVLEQYRSALAAATRSIYLENQAFGSPWVVDAVEAALRRGVAVVFLVPGNAHPAFVEARKDPHTAFYFEKFARLAEHENFALAGIAASRGAGRYDEIYVHAKIGIVDDAWVTIGSTNIAERSFHKDTELNASFWHAETARALRVELFGEHLGSDTSALDDRAALQRFQEVARSNRERRARSEMMHGLAYAITPGEYGAA